MEATRRSIDFRVRQSASKINDLLAKVAHLNSTILRLKSQGVEPNDEMDSRDLAVREVSKYMDVRCSYDDKGHYNLTLGGKMPLVTGESAYHFETVPTERDAPGEGTKQDGALDIFLVSESGTFHPIRHAIKNGELYGLIHVRDDVMTELKDRMDRMVGTFASKVNAIHRQGFGRDGLSGRNLFSGVGVGSIEFPESFVDGMERIHLNFDTSQTNMLAHALVPHAPSDNRVPLAIAALEHDRIYENGTVTLQDFYAATVGDLGVKVKSFRDSDDNFGSILRQLNTYHQSVTGVSMDEEAAKMVQMQHQFNASAKMIRTADELMETVLSLKR
jgi:flagellar hook-associated protein 1 FlgK